MVIIPSQKVFFNLTPILHFENTLTAVFYSDSRGFAFFVRCLRLLFPDTIRHHRERV